MKPPRVPSKTIGNRFPHLRGNQVQREQKAASNVKASKNFAQRNLDRYISPSALKKEKRK